MSYNPNEPRKSFESDEFSRRPSVDPAPAGFTGLVIGAIVVLGALIAFLMFRADTDTTTLGMNPATQQQQQLPSATPNNDNRTGPTNPAPQTPPANSN